MAKAPIKLEAVGHTNTGLVRSENQDAYLIDLKNSLFILADGMGGKKAVSAMPQFNALFNIESNVTEDEDELSEEKLNALEESV